MYGSEKVKNKQPGYICTNAGPQSGISDLKEVGEAYIWRHDGVADVS